MLTIRTEQPGDYRAVEELIRRAFWNVNSPGCDEHYLAHVLRSHPDFLPQLDLVAELDDQLVASVMYTRATLAAREDTEKPVLTFGPLAVLPQYQRKGYGKQLLEASFAIARQLGYDAIVIFGNPENYIPRGFCSCRKYDVCLSEGVYPTALLVKELTPGALAGHSWQYRESPAYNIDPAAAQAFDASFPPLEKGYQPSQELFSIYSRSRVLR